MKFVSVSVENAPENFVEDFGAKKTLSIFERALAYVQLTKPRIIFLFSLTGLAAMIVEGSLWSSPFRLWMVVLGIAFTGGSANAFNQFLDRDIDGLMERTKSKRPIPNGSLSPQGALVFASIMGLIATFLLVAFGGVLAAVLGLATIFYYVVVYTMWLKRTTPYNIVIGGAAGASGPLIGWAAATGTISFAAFVLFLLIFMWTPPHFWALSICLKDQYKKVSIPMLPVVSGVEETKQQIFLYSLALVPLSLVPFVCGSSGFLYFIGALVLGVNFLRHSIRVLKSTPQTLTQNAWKMFIFSIIYLLLLFVILMGDSAFKNKAYAGEKTPIELKGVGLQEHFGEKVDLDLTFKDEKGQVRSLRSVVNGSRPVMLLLAYYSCPNLCNLFLNGVTEGLKGLKYLPGKEFEILTISIDPREEAALASKKKDSHIEALGRAAASVGWHFWTNNEVKKDPNALDANVKKLAEQVGFHYHFDQKTDQFAHTSAIIMLTPKGIVARYLPGIQFKSEDLKLAIGEAGEGKVGTILDQLLLYCFHYDPEARSYSPHARNIMRAGGGLTVLILAAVLGLVIQRSHRSNSNPSDPDQFNSSTNTRRIS